jgi:antitoxin component HigA of HigAB toxin-antitoxin module
MNIKVIKTEEDYQRALKRLEVIFVSRKRKFSLQMIRNLHEKLKIPYETLIVDY